MNKARYDELDDIRKDIESLRRNVVSLSKSVKHDVSTGANEQVHILGERSREAAFKLEKRVKEYPGQSLLVAFAGGLVTSALLHRR